MPNPKGQRANGNASLSYRALSRTPRSEKNEVLSRQNRRLVLIKLSQHVMCSLGSRSLRSHWRLIAVEEFFRRDHIQERRNHSNKCIRRWNLEKQSLLDKDTNLKRSDSRSVGVRHPPPSLNKKCQAVLLEERPNYLSILSIEHDAMIVLSYGQAIKAHADKEFGVGGTEAV